MRTGTSWDHRTTTVHTIPWCQRVPRLRVWFGKWVTYNLDCSDLREVRRRVVEPVVRCLFGPDELAQLDLRFGPPPGHQAAHGSDDPEVWLVLTARGEQFEWRVCKATDETWGAQQQAEALYEALRDWFLETDFAWGEDREGEFVIPPPFEG
jgi:hypothetical protein